MPVPKGTKAAPLHLVTKYDAACTALLTAAGKALAIAKTPAEVKDVHDRTEALRIYAKRIKNPVAEADAWEIRKWAEDKLGGISKALEKGFANPGPGRGKKGLPVGGKSFKTQSLKAVGVSTSAANRYEQFHTLPVREKQRRLALGREAILAGKSIADAILRQDSAARRASSRQAEPLPDACEYRIGDCREALADIPDNSVPLILTDPPYGNEAEVLYEWLADFASRVLIPGGSLICYTGHSRLDRDIRILSARLRYWWLLAMMHNQSQRFPGKFVIVRFKPVLWYVKEFRRGRSLVPDVLISPKRDKEFHNWGQGEGGISPLVEHLTEPNELIIDPFAGTGTWGRIATQMGRRWIGCDVVHGGSTEVHID